MPHGAAATFAGLGDVTFTALNAFDDGLLPAVLLLPPPLLAAAGSAYQAACSGMMDWSMRKKRVSMTSHSICNIVIVSPARKLSLRGRAGTRMAIFGRVVLLWAVAGSNQ